MSIEKSSVLSPEKRELINSIIGRISLKDYEQKEKFKIIKEKLEELGEKFITYPVDGLTIWNVACLAGNPDLLEFLMSTYEVDINAINPYRKRTGLHDATLKVNFDNVKWLLQHNANTSLKDERGRLPIDLVSSSTGSDADKKKLRELYLSYKDRKNETKKSPPPVVTSMRKENSMLRLFSPTARETPPTLRHRKPPESTTTDIPLQTFDKSSKEKSS